MRNAPLVVALLASSALAQTIVMPSAAAATDGNTSSGWPFDVANIHIQYIYDSSHFTSQGITSPILLNRLKVRANGATATWAGGSSNLTLVLSTAPFDHAAITNTFATNLGPDQTTVYSGGLTIPGGSSTAGSPGPYHVDIVFTTPFLYDPNAGDLTIDYLSTGLTIANTPTLDGVSTTGTALAHRMQTTVVANATGTIWSGEFANVIEFSYTPPAGLFASFSADVTSGASPLTVNFSDTSFSSDPGGANSWAWDFNGDTIIDSTLQNPQFVYGSCGDYTVTLTVTDASHPPSSVTQTGYIQVDDVTLTPTFTVTPINPTLMQFTDTTSPTPTSWDWDFDGDNVTDATGPTPIWAFPAACSAANVKLTVSRLCRGPFSATKGIVVGAQVADVSPVGAQGTQASPWVGVFLDIAVHNPVGLSVCAATINTYAFAGPYDVRFYLTPDTYVGKDTNIALWRLIGEGAGTVPVEGTVGAPNTSIAALDTPMYLPPGNYGLAVYIGQPAGNAGISYSSTSQGTTGNADISFYPNPGTAPGISRTGLFGGSSFGPPRVWNGELHYTTCTLSSAPGYGFFAPGCAGTLPVSTNVSTAVPRLGQNMTAQFDNLPHSVGLMLLGFSRTTSTFGALPLDLTGLGMPGCFGRVSPDLSYFFLGAANAGSVSVFIPNDPVFLCLPFYTQTFVFDTAANSFGAVMSDAAAAVIGA